VTAPRIERSIDLPGSPEQVWRALTEPDGLSAWFGARASVEAASRGSHIEFRRENGGVQAAVLEEVVPPKRLVFRWLPFEKSPEGMRRVPGGRVEFTLEQVDEGTRLTVLEIGPADYPATTMGVR
jgi:uncharacterized protein YndB with AHSA1/START domain